MSARKTILGEIESLNEVFEEIRLIKTKQGDYDYGKGFYFIAGLDGGLILKNYIAVGRPHLSVLKRVEDLCCDARVGSFSWIPWKNRSDEIKGLIKATDRMMIANPWVAYLIKEPKIFTIEDVESVS